MSRRVKVTAILGTYRKGGITDQAVTEILAAAAGRGAEVSKIFLIDKNIRYCTNCRICTQSSGGSRGTCVLTDDMNLILDEIEASDALVLASPMNFGTVTAVMKTFIERLVRFAYWPWGAAAPKDRCGKRSKKAVVVASSAAPAVMARPASKMVALMKTAAGLLGARTVGVQFIGFAAMKPDARLSPLEKFRSRRLGKKLASR